MQFEIPTTKEKMYEVLSDIFYYYRIKKDDYIDFILPDLTLERMQMTVQTPEQIRATATTILSPKQTREIAEYKAKIKEKISEVNDLIDQEETSKNNQISEVNSKYLLDVAELNRQATDKGFLNSSMYTEMLASLENEKNQKIALITEQSATTIARLNEQITALNQKIENAEDSSSAFSYPFPLHFTPYTNQSLKNFPTRVPACTMYMPVGSACTGSVVSAPSTIAVITTLPCRSYTTISSPACASFINTDKYADAGLG